MVELIVSDREKNSGYISYVYNAVAGIISQNGGVAELVFQNERTYFRMEFSDKLISLEEVIRQKITEVLGIGYKYRFLNEKLFVSLSRKDRKLLCAALIAADYDIEKSMIETKLPHSKVFHIDGVFDFRLKFLEEKWQKITEYIPADFSANDFKRFCDFLTSESKKRVYVQGNRLFGENFVPLKKSKLLGEQDIQTEIMLSDAGYIYCLDKIEDSLSKFLQKYYAERAVFS